MEKFRNTWIENLLKKSFKQCYDSETKQSISFFSDLTYAHKLIASRVVGEHDGATPTRDSATPSPNDPSPQPCRWGSVVVSVLACGPQGPMGSPPLSYLPPLSKVVYSDMLPFPKSLWLNSGLEVKYRIKIGIKNKNKLPRTVKNVQKLPRWDSVENRRLFSA